MRTSQLPVSGQNPQLPNMEGEDGDPKKASVLGWIHFLTQGPGEEGWYLVGVGRSEGRTSSGPILFCMFSGREFRAWHHVLVLQPHPNHRALGGTAHDRWVH